MQESLHGDSLDEVALVVGLRQGDESAYGVFVRKFAPRAMQIARRILGNEADAADAVQDAFLSAMRSIQGFRADSQLSTWFHRVATNAALMTLRSRHRKDLRSIEDLLPKFQADGHRAEARASWSDSPLRVLEEVERRSMIRQKISQLPEDFRNVVLLRDIQQMSTSDAARQLGVSESVVKTRLHRARQALRSLIEEELVSG